MSPVPSFLRVSCTRPERRHLGHLVAGAVPAERLGQPAQHQIAVGLQHHVDEVDDDDAADVAQPQLAHGLLGGLEIVARDGLLEVAAGAGELAGVDVDHGHRLGAVDHQGAARRQPHLAVQRLGQLFVDAVHGEHVRTVGRGGFVLGHPRNQFRRNGIDVVVDGLPGVVTGHDEAGEVLVEQVADDLDQHVGLFVERDRRACGLLRWSRRPWPRPRFQRSCSRFTSVRMSSSLTPSDAVRMITPASAGTTSRRISLSR